MNGISAGDGRRRPSHVEAAQTVGLGDPADGDHVGGLAQGDPARRGHLRDRVERRPP